ncbi:hypothetical protein JY651_40015 [Pyxidicoccus parkwayensis]|uniref:Lipoprotein n=1 Tax=Pyxidicoccus parkwayensis TaxID=2813578 RepID=A0ABX7NR17_9BACT|nr:hypothetical protein [Pyxidicoccus parkwaysis]QSQ21312.1 hypothetical protein JY651_40015 [Pyxidicoccus parkwaysis]
MRLGLMLGCCLAVMGLVACSSEDGEEGLRQGRVKLKDGQSIAQAQECGVNLPQCPQGTDCISFKLDGASQVRCLDTATVCGEVLTCTGGTECVILESYPGQVTCSGKCTGSDCDSSVSSSP